jgi:hypothetical protein
LLTGGPVAPEEYEVKDEAGQKEAHLINIGHSMEAAQPRAATLSGGTN